MKYQKLKKWKYRLTADYQCQTDIKPEASILTEYVQLTNLGYLFVKKGYAWDGASGPCPDCVTVMKASLIHDSLCQMMRSNRLPRSWRNAVDHELERQCLKDGMSRFWAKVVYLGVNLLGGSEVHLEIVQPEIEIP